MEFGIHLNHDDEPIIMLTSELSPDVSSLWDLKTGKSLDYTLSFEDAEDALIGYKEITRRLDLDSAKAILTRQSN